MNNANKALATFLTARLSASDLSQLKKLVGDAADGPASGRVALDALPARLRPRIVEDIHRRQGEEEQRFLERWPNAARIAQSW